MLRYLFYQIVFGIIFCTSFLQAKIDNPFLKDQSISLEVVITSYNNEEFYYRNLDSLWHQKVSVPMHITYVNDASTDNTGACVDRYKDEHDMHGMMTVIHNTTRVGMLENLYNTIHSLPDHVIVVRVDGDDFLAHDNVLERVVQEYQNKSVWFTYSRMIYYPEGWVFCEPLPQEVMQQNTFREYRWVTSHLHTFYAGLFKKIAFEDFMYNGKSFKMAGDLAFVYPLLELASQGHISFIPDVLYVYNHHNPISDHNVDFFYQTTLAHAIRSRHRYAPLY